MRAASSRTSGTYNPRSKPADVQINKARVQHWLSKGARPSDSVRTLLAKHLSRDLSAPVEHAGGAVGHGAHPTTEQRLAVRCARSSKSSCVPWSTSPTTCQVTESQRRGMTMLELTTAPGDMGKVIGRQGRTVSALRTLVSLTAEKHGQRAQLDLRD